MNPSDLDVRFSGSIPEFYDRYMVPIFFEPYAEDMAERVAAREPSRVLELAAGTGVLTRELARSLPRSTSITASDLSHSMLDRAWDVGTESPVHWQQADAMELPFADEEFDLVVCEFGVMFFPDKPRCFSEARRVLRPGGALIFNVWDRLEENEFSHCFATAFDDVPEHLNFLTRVPFGYHDLSVIGNDLAAGGFNRPTKVTTVAKISRAPSPEVAATALGLGTPFRTVIESQEAANLDEALEIATQAFSKRFGVGAIEGQMKAHVVEVER